MLYDAEDLLVSARKEQIVQELMPLGEQLSMDELLLSLIPRERPSAEELIASELHAQRAEVG